MEKSVQKVIILIKLYMYNKNNNLALIHKARIL